MCQGHDCCGGSAPVDGRLIALLQRTRDILGVSLYCCDPAYPGAGSGFRCMKHNATVDGASPNSLHTCGLAADVWTISVEPIAIRDAALTAVRQLAYGYVRYYPEKRFVHIDIGRNFL